MFLLFLHFPSLHILAFLPFLRPSFFLLPFSVNMLYYDFDAPCVISYHTHALIGAQSFYFLPFYSSLLLIIDLSTTWSSLFFFFFLVLLHPLYIITGFSRHIESFSFPLPLIE